MKVLKPMIFLLVILTGPTVFAATFNVINPVQFQAALTTARSNGTDDTINVAAGNYNITTTLSYVPPGASEGRLTIQGAGADSTILDGGGSVQILNIDTSNLTDDSGAHIVVRAMTFQNGDNGAGPAGGLYAYTSDGNIAIENSDFEDNTASGTGGGALAVSLHGTVALNGNRFVGNSASSVGGGAMVAAGGAGGVSLANNVFSNNSAEEAGGAGVEALGAPATLTNNTFSGNSATNGASGGLHVLSDNSVNLTNNIFRSNTASNGGAGGVGAFGNTVAMTSNTLISNSAAGVGGGVLLEAGEEVTLTNNTFNNNASMLSGGGAMLLASSVTVTNNTFGGNSAVNVTGGLGVQLIPNSASADIYNNIIWGNTAPAGADLSVGADGNIDGIGSTVNLYNNDIGEFFIDDNDNLAQASNIDQDPLLTLDFHLQGGSPAVDAGYNAAPGLPAIDFDGEPRVMNGTVDIGADEYPGPVIRHTVPTVNEWGLIILAALLAGAVINVIRKQGKV